MNHNDIVQKLWGLCDVLRDDGINYSEYVTELVLLLFIKMMHEKKEADLIPNEVIPEEYQWPTFTELSGVKLLQHYKKALLELSQHENESLAAIYDNAKTSLREPRHLEQLVKNFEKLDWYSTDKDQFGDLYEGLLQKNANETKSGAGQYFTPRVLIESMVRCIKPEAGELIQDPAAGTAGFLIAADSYIKKQTDDLMNLSEDEREFQEKRAFQGIELVPNTRRLALMNCLLHDMEGEGEGPIALGNSLGLKGEQLPKADVILANPPFGTSKGGEASITRSDLTHTTSNKQLAFLQHIYRGLKPGGRAAVVLPDNVLFESETGTRIRQDLMDKCNLHTILRLPTGIFYAQGVKTNVLFFTRGSATDPYQEENCTENVWIYDLRSKMPNFGKRTPFTRKHLASFEKLYGISPDGTSKRVEGDWFQITPHQDDNDYSRWKSFSRDWIAQKKEDSLDISWIKNGNETDPITLPAPSKLAEEAAHILKSALNDIEALSAALQGKHDAS